MRKTIFIYAIISGLCFTACKNKVNDKQQADVLVEVKRTNPLKVDSVEIRLDSESLPVYNQGVTAVERNGILNVLAYNPKTRNIDVFDLHSGTIDHIVIQGIEKFGLMDVFALEVAAPDTILAYSYPSLFILSGSGEIIDKKDLKVEFEGKKGFLSGDVDARPFYDSKTGDVYGLLRYDKEEDRFNSPIGVRLNINTGSYEVLPVFLDQEYKEKLKQLGYNNQFQISFYQDKAVLNYSYSSDLYVCDYASGQTTCYTTDPDEFYFVTENSSQNELMDAYVKNTFHALPFIHKDNIALLTWGPGISSVFDKKTSLNVASLSERTIISDVLAGNDYFISSAQLTGDRLIIQRYNPNNTNDTCISFAIVELQDNF